LESGNVIFKSGLTEQQLTTELGRARLETPVAFKWQDAVRIYLPPNQTVFNSIPAGAGSVPFLVGPMIKINEFSGEFVSSNGNVRHRMTFTASPMAVTVNGVTFSGDFFGRWVADLDFGY
jgi:hypothetical protein